MAATALPVNQIIGQTFAHVFGNLRPLIRAAAVPWAVMVAVALRGEIATQEGGMATYAIVLWSAIQMAAVVPFQTQVYRFAVAITADSTPRFGWPWGMRETRYALNIVALMVLTAGIMTAVILLAFAAIGGPGTASSDEALGRVAVVFLLVGAPTAVILFYATARLSLVLPAASVGHATNWRALWRATSGHGWRLVWIMIVTTLPGLLASGFIQAMRDGAPIFIVALPLDMLAAGANLLTIALPASAVGFVYRSLVVNAVPRPPTVSLLA